MSLEKLLKSWPFTLRSASPYDIFVFDEREGLVSKSDPGLKQVVAGGPIQKTGDNEEVIALLLSINESLTLLASAVKWSPYGAKIDVRLDK